MECWSVTIGAATSLQHIRVACAEDDAPARSTDIEGAPRLCVARPRHGTQPGHDLPRIVLPAGHPGTWQ